MPLAAGGEHGTEGSGAGGQRHRSARGALGQHRTTTHANDQGRRDAAVFVREGVQWRELRASARRACGSTLRRRLDGWSTTALLRQVHAILIRMVRAGPETLSWDVVVDSCSVRAKHGGELTGPNPTDRG